MRNLGALSAIVAIVVLGCSAHKMDAKKTIQIVVLGQSARVPALQAIAAAHHTSTAMRGGQVSADVSIANSELHFSTYSTDADIDSSMVNAADVAIIVIDALDYQPATIEACVKLLKETSTIEIILLFANTRDILLDKKEAVELLELCELDVREYLNKHGLDGDNAPWFYDSRNVIPDDRPPTGTSVEAVLDHILK